MLREFLLWLFATTVVEPYQAELTRQLALARAPHALVEAVAGCASAAIPALADRASSDPWWTLTNGLRVWIGVVPADAILRDAAPACGPAIDAARPYLTGGAA